MATQTGFFPEAGVVELKDTQFMTAEEKRKVLRQWASFLKSGTREGFTELLYNHLIMHCSFIAHYDRRGFYATYFSEPEDTIHFLSQFDNRNGLPRSVEYHSTGWYTDSDYHDINAEMCNIASQYIPSLVKRLRTDQENKDVERAKLLLAKHGLKANIE